MNKNDYYAKVSEVLDSQVTEISSRLNACLEKLPPRTKDITIGVHVDQDGEGFLDLMVHLGGPDLYVLNKAISDTARLFSTTMSSEGLEPPLPIMEPHGEEFYVPDALTDCAIEWVRSRWPEIGNVQTTIPISVASMEGYGTYECVPLNSRANGA